MDTNQIRRLIDADAEKCRRQEKDLRTRHSQAVGILTDNIRYADNLPTIEANYESILNGDEKTNAELIELFQQYKTELERHREVLVIIMRENEEDHHLLRRLSDEISRCEDLIRIGQGQGLVNSLALDEWHNNRVDSALGVAWGNLNFPDLRSKIISLAVAGKPILLPGKEELEGASESCPQAG